MKKDEVIRIAREAGLLPNPEVYVEDLERFTELISATERERIKAANEPVIEHINRYLSEMTAAITALRAALAQQDEGGGNLPPPLQAHCPNCAGPETQNTELDRKAASAKRGEALYHPCTYILILGLKKLNAYDVLAEWDKARAEVDALAHGQTEKVK